MVKHSQNADSAPKKVAIITTGRFNPPTRGHAALIETLNVKAALFGWDPYVFVTHSVDKKGKNPLDWKTKQSFMKRLIPSANIIEDDSVKHAWDAIEWLKNKGYTGVVLMVGSDRINEFKVRWLPYAQKVFEMSQIISGGLRDPSDMTTTAGMSATKAREAALLNNLDAFRAATGWSDDISIELMSAVRAGMVGE